MDQPGIYAIVHVLTGKRYVGQTTSFDRRWAQHRKALDGGFHHNGRLLALWRADGPAAFEFKALEQAPAYLNGKPLQKWLAQREAYYISTHKATASALNIMDAELVETKASRAPAPPSKNSQVFSRIVDLKPEIATAEALAAEARGRFNVQEKQVESLRSSARPGLLGMLGFASLAEKQRRSKDQERLAREQQKLEELRAELTKAQDAADALKEQRRRLYNSYDRRGPRRAR